MSLGGFFVAHTLIGLLCWCCCITGNRRDEHQQYILFARSSVFSNQTDVF